MLKGANHLFKAASIVVLASAAIALSIALNTPAEPLAQEENRSATDAQLESAAFTHALLGHVVRDVAWAQGESLVSLLRREGVLPDDANALAQAVHHIHGAPPPAFDRNVRLSFRVSEDNQAELAGLTWRCELGAYLSAVRTGETSYIARHVAIPLAFEVVAIRGRVGEGLAESALAQGATEREVEALANAFAYSLDFQREVRPNDRFEIVFERVFDEVGRTVQTGRTLFISITSQRGREFFFSFQPQGQAAPSWYNNLGHSAERSLVRTPVAASRISSRYGMRRDPIQGYSAMHHGIDFAAPRGTPVVAAGDGLIVRSSWNGSYGNYVRIRHPSGYETAYAHLELYARGVRAGARVRQNQVIGYVGSTGRTTGPHLHYEVFRAGAQLDPMQVRGTLSRALSGADYEGFRSEVERIDALRASLSRGVTRVPSLGVAAVMSIDASDPAATGPAFIYNAATAELAWDGDGAGGAPSLVLTRLGPHAPGN